MNRRSFLQKTAKLTIGLMGLSSISIPKKISKQEQANKEIKASDLLKYYEWSRTHNDGGFLVPQKFSEYLIQIARDQGVIISKRRGLL